LRPFKAASSDYQSIYHAEQFAHSRGLQGFMQNEDDLHEIAKRCQRVAVIIKNTADNGNLKQSASVVKATQTLHE